MNIITRCIYYIVLALTAQSCNVYETITTFHTEIDLSKFAQKGIFITTSEYFGKYQSISLIEIYCLDGYAIKEIILSDSNNEIYGGQKKEKNIPDLKNFRKCTVTDLLDRLMIIAENKKANGIIHVTLSESNNLIGDRKGIKLSALLIDIE